jgi:hypothetical protein
VGSKRRSKGCYIASRKARRCLRFFPSLRYPLVQALAGESAGVREHSLYRTVVSFQSGGRSAFKGDTFHISCYIHEEIPEMKDLNDDIDSCTL